MKNRQLRNWVFMLYPDNEKHINAINYLDLIDNSLYIKHIERKDDNGEMINKEHFHCIMKFDQGYWLSTLLNDLGLDETDSHLFHSYKDFIDNKGHQKFRSLEDYVNYLDHQLNENKPDKYDINDFHGGLVQWASEIINNRESAKYEIFLDLSLFIRKYRSDHVNDTQGWGFVDWYELCCKNGYGKIFYDNWYKIRDILKQYVYY